MMKNRDTPSNPYRVPRQPTAQWIKVSIVMLFLCNATLMGGVVYLVFASRECAKVCLLNVQGNSRDMHRQSSPNLMPKDGEENPIVRQEEIIRLLARRVDGVSEMGSRLQKTMDRLDELCRKKAFASGSKTSAESTSERGLEPRQHGLETVVGQMQLKISNIGTQLEQLVTSRQLCMDGHYRFGVYCMYIGEAALSQAAAKNLCMADYDAQGALVLIKDKFMHEFVTGKIPNRLHSYWIGIERQRLPLVAGGISYIRSQRSEDKGALEVPLPLASDGSHLSDSSLGPAPFDYVDGTKVQNKVWQIWGPRSNRHDNRQSRDCVALSYDQDGSAWYWQEHDCGTRLGYVCQYFIMSVGH